MLNIYLKFIRRPIPLKLHRIRYKQQESKKAGWKKESLTCREERKIITSCFSPETMQMRE